MLSILLAAIPVVAGALLVMAALHDVALRAIPNAIPLALLGVGVILRLQDGGILSGLGLAFAVFVAAAVCWRRGWMGGGDVKLLAATALVLPPVQVGWFLVFTAWAGGALGLIYLVLSRTVRLPRPAPSRSLRGVTPRGVLFRILRAERWRICRGAPLPYGFAIAAGGITLLLK